MSEQKLDKAAIIASFMRCGTPGACSKNCAYFGNGFRCWARMRDDIVKLLGKVPDEPKEEESFHFHCAYCARDMETEWTYCPYCGTAVHWP